MQVLAMRKYIFIIDFLNGVQTNGRHCYTNTKAGICKKMYDASHIQ